MTGGGRRRARPSTRPGSSRLVWLTARHRLRPSLAAAHRQHHGSSGHRSPREQLSYPPSRTGPGSHKPHAGGEPVGTYRENLISLNIQRLADLKKSAAQLERALSDTGVSFEHEIVQSVYNHQAAPDHIHGTCDCATLGIASVPDAE